MLQIYDCCKDFLRTIPDLIMDEHKFEDVDTKGEDHCYDEACHICMFRPLSPDLKKPKLSLHDKRIDALKKGDTSSYEHIATIQQERELRRFGFEDPDFGEVEHMEDGNLKPTIIE
jgi:hypothetical protein